MPRHELQDLYERYASTHAGEEPTPPNALQELIKHLPRDQSGPIIDLGCGQGGLVAAIRRAGYTRVKGIDLSPEQVAVAKDRGIEGIQQGDVVELLASETQSYSAITATDFFEHLTRPQLLQLVPIIHDALLPGGLVIGRVPNAVSPFGGNYRHGDFTHESWFTGRSVRQLLALSGFASVSILPSHPAPHGIVSALRSIVWHIYSGFFKLGLAAETGVLRGNIVTQNLIFIGRKSPGGIMTH